MIEQHTHLGRIEFIRAYTRVAPVPLVPELRLHQADDALDLWGALGLRMVGGDAPLPFWAFPWAGGTALARYVLDHRAVVADRRFLDLGSGSGLVACAAMKAGALEVGANDVDPFAIAAIDLNAEANRVSVTPILGDLLDRPDHPAFGGIDVVVAGDVAYERAMAERMFALLLRLTGGGIKVYIGDLGRAYLPDANLEPLATYEVPVSPGLEDSDTKRTRVFRLTS